MNTPWEEVSLGEVADDVTVGHVGPMADQYVEAGIPFLRSLNVEPFRVNTTDLKHISREFHQRLKKSALKPGDVVIVRTGKPGSCAVIPDWLSEANCSDVVVVRANPRVRPSFISYVVNSSAAHHIDAHTVGAVQQHFNVSSARQIRFQLPSIAEQDRILGVLGALDDKIELNRRMNETLEAMARAIFKDWFVDFGPTRAKMEGRAPYLTPDIWCLFPDRLDDDGTPEGWTGYSLGMLATQHTASVTPTSSPDETFEHFSLPAYDAGQAPSQDRGEAIKSNKTLVPEGAILLSKLNPEIERVWLPQKATGKRQICSTEFLVFTPKANFTRSVLFGLFTEPLFRTMLQSMVTGTSKSHQRISPPALLGRQVLVSANPLFSRFAEQVEPLLDRVLANRAESGTLAATRDLLLPKLMSGEIRVRDAEKLIEEVA